MKNNIKSKYLFLSVLAMVAASKALAVAPTDMDGVVALGDTYITKATLTAVGAAILGFGWVGYRLVKKFVKGAAST